MNIDLSKLITSDAKFQRAIADKWESIKASRDAAEFGKFTALAHVFDGDEQSKSRISDAVLMAVLSQSAGQPFSINWTLADNSVVALSGAQMIAVGTALGQHVAQTFEKGRALRTQIKAAQNHAALNLIAW